MNKEVPEYTEAYTFKEKLAFIGKVIIATLLFVTVYHYYLFPMQKQYLDNMHCSETFVESLRFMLIILVMIMIVFTIYLVFYAKNIIKFKQVPYRDKKYLNRIKIIRGKKAIIKGWIIIFLSIALMVASIGIYVSSEYEILNKIGIIKIDKSDCQMIK